LNSFDVIVAGLGAMGSAAADHLARRGAAVLGIDPWPVPHAHGSSGGDTRLIRKAYFEHPDYVPLLQRAYDNWRALQADAGEQLLFETGTVYLGPPDGELIAGSRRAADAHGLALEALDDDDLARRFPQLSRPEGYAAVFEPDAGFLLCERAVAAQAARARARGAQLHLEERVLRWRADGTGVEVTTDRGRYRAGALVLTVGSWSMALLEGLRIPLQVTRQPLFWLPAPAGLALDESPCWAVQRHEAPGLFYGFPALPETLGCRPGIKVAHHAPGEPADPDAPRAPARPQELESVLAAMAPAVPALRGPASASMVCLYTNSADGHFVVDRHPEHDQVVFGCGFSGHGFKFASVMGEALADLALHGASPLPIGFLGLGR
jgi:sarcosine oxidase